MTFFFNRKFGLSLFSLFIYFSAFSQNQPVQVLNIFNGLSNNLVTNICEDKDGFMWFGTFDGLNMYDGYSFTVYNNSLQPHNSLASSTVYCVASDSNGYIWAGGPKGVSVFNKNKLKFKPVHFLNRGRLQLLNNVTHQIESSGKSVLVATQMHGLILFKNGSFTGSIIPLGNSKKKSYNVSAISEITNGNRYIYVRDYGICKLNIATNKLQLVYKCSMEVKCLQSFKDGQLLLGTDNGLFLFDTKVKKLSQNYFKSKVTISNIMKDKNERILLATDGGKHGIYELKNNAVYPYYPGGNPKNMMSNVVWDIFEDSSGNKWYATLRGGIMMEGNITQDFKTIRYDNDNEKPEQDFIFSFCEDNDKNLWIGTDGGGLRVWNRKNNSYTLYNTEQTDFKKIFSNCITSLIKDSNNNIWFSTWGGGVGRIKAGHKNAERFSCYNEDTGRNEENVWCVYQDKYLNIWACATNTGYLYLFNQELQKFEVYNKAIANLQSITSASDGKLWGGNYTELIEIDVKLNKHKIYNIGYIIRCIYEDRDKQLWIGTQEGGLLKFNPENGKYKRFTLKDGLPSNTILRILEDDQGTLWMSTFNGLSQFNSKREHFRNFSIRDGLQSSQFSYNASLKLSSGEFVFGGLSGFNIFYPNDIKDAHKNKPIVLSGFKINNKPVEKFDEIAVSSNKFKTKQVILPYEYNTFSLEFLTLDYNDGDKISYAYQIKGRDKSWYYSGKSKTANYTKLPEGDYIFSVKGTNLRGGWDKAYDLIEIKILPPWYRTWWAYLIYIFVGAGIITGYVRYSKNRHQIKLKINKANMERDREKELSERQRAMFTYITHEFRTPLSLIVNPLKKILLKNAVIKNADSLSSEMHVAYRNAKRLLSLVDQLLLFKKAESDAYEPKLSKFSINILLNEVFLCFVNLAKEKRLNYHFTNSENNIEIYADYEKIEIVIFNLVSNAIKYTPEDGSVTLSLEESDDKVVINVKDTGVGITEGEKPFVFDKFRRDRFSTMGTGFGVGLYVVKYFVEQHKGNVVFSSIANKGTTFTVLLNKNLQVDNEVVTHPGPNKMSELLIELMPHELENKSDIDLEDVNDNPQSESMLLSDKKSVLLIDDDTELLDYLKQLFSNRYILYSAMNGEDGLEIARKQLPDLIISDIQMDGLSGLELCKAVKNDKELNHIPIILLTGTTNNQTQIEGIIEGADDYITKPFDSDILLAKAARLIKRRDDLRAYFLNNITLQENKLKVPLEYQKFLEDCIEIIEKNIENNDFTAQEFSKLMGLSYRMLYDKINMISGQSLNAFIRAVRLRRAAYLMLTESNITIAQSSTRVGLEDQKYFRQQFVALFGMTPSVYIKKYRSSFNKDLKIIKDQNI